MCERERETENKTEGVGTRGEEEGQDGGCGREDGAAEGGMWLVVITHTYISTELLDVQQHGSILHDRGARSG